LISLIFEFLLLFLTSQLLFGAGARRSSSGRTCSEKVAVSIVCLLWCWNNMETVLVFYQQAVVVADLRFERHCLEGLSSARLSGMSLYSNSSRLSPAEARLVESAKIGTSINL
jgi:hypothetical protein